MSWFGSKSRAGLQLGVGFHADGISLAALDRSGDSGALTRCAFLPAEGAQAQGEQLSCAVKDFGLKGLPTVAVLDPGNYSLLQVEAPEVEPDELRNAIKWRIKDLLDFHIDDAVLDVFDMPESQRKGAPRLMYVVAARMAQIQARVDQLETAGLEIAAIDITELAIRNLLSATYSGTGFHALLYLAPQYGVIEIVQGETLYLNRRIEINASDLEAQGGFGLEDMLEALVLELQRSLDYHESQFAMGGVARISIVSPESRSADLQSLASENLMAEVGGLVLAERLDNPGQLPADQFHRCLPAIGGAMRIV